MVTLLPCVGSAGRLPWLCLSVLQLVKSMCTVPSREMVLSVNSISVSVMFHLLKSLQRKRSKQIFYKTQVAITICLLIKDSFDNSLWKIFQSIFLTFKSYGTSSGKIFVNMHWKNMLIPNGHCGAVELSAPGGSVFGVQYFILGCQILPSAPSLKGHRLLHLAAVNVLALRFPLSSFQVPNWFFPSAVGLGFLFEYV